MAKPSPQAPQQNAGPSSDAVNVACDPVVADLSVNNCAALEKYRKPDGSLDYDYFYDHPEESELLMECSLVRHMIGQIKIGMDLSRITLPTFILERRSLLEMYADHFAHPQLFVAIADGQSTRERMLAALRWYLSSFHAGRNYDIAKKPYNPILGEIFQCYYDFDQSSSSGPNSVTREGPVPWAKDTSLTFYAEQVSHHPPVSAFYTECVEKKIMCNADIWTKSRFTGLSIGVINVGKAVVSVLDYSEQYIFTFPSAYAKGILNVPYVELGGNVTASCPQTGYKAEIEFLTRSFWTNKGNRLACKLYTPGVPNPTDIIEGDWTGALKFKKCLDSTGRDVFIDVTRAPLSKKIVKSIPEQGPRESRFLWRNVTASLFVNQIDMATKYKSELEQLQRHEAADRKQKNLNYEGKRFSRTTNDEESPWWYLPNLFDRLHKANTTNNKPKN